MSGSPGYRYSVERITDGTGPARERAHHTVMLRPADQQASAGDELARILDSVDRTGR
jgi:hypothetical protein